MALVGILCSIFRVGRGVFRSVGSVAGGIGCVGSSVGRRLNRRVSRSSRRGCSAGSLLSLIGSLAGCICSGLGLISSLGCLCGRSRGRSLLRGVSSLLRVGYA